MQDGLTSEPSGSALLLVSQIWLWRADGNVLEGVSHRLGTACLKTWSGRAVAAAQFVLPVHRFASSGGREAA